MNKVLLTISLAGLFILTACGKGNHSEYVESKISEIENPIELKIETNLEKMLDWSSISKDYHPKIIEHEFSTVGLDFVELNINGISDEVDVHFLENDSSKGKIRLFRVWRETTGDERIKLKTTSNQLEFKSDSDWEIYLCSKSVENRKLVHLSGGCTIFVEIYLPTSSKIKVISKGRLVSKS